MDKAASLSRAAHLYIYCVIAVGLLAVMISVVSLVIHPISKQWLILVALTLLTGSFSVKVPSLSARFSVSEAFVFAAVLLFGPAAATALVALDSLIISLWLRPNRRSLLRSLFNCSAVALAIWLAAHVFFWLADASPGALSELLPLERHLWHLFALAALYFLLNSGFVALALSFERNVSAPRLWMQHFPWFSLNYFGGVSVAALLVSYTRSVDLSAIGIILPLLVISYITHRTSLGRVDDAQHHVEQVNNLYMSTIEALAMAVDAKDQITHGHIRRVQVYAVALARRLGVTDAQQIRALETAALLHDMGKLAIPEHILNKPGQLTSAEFSYMKRHADIGARLLSSIPFPYPVVPIVRHHHEQWDGHGYPAGIARTDIPLGARILAVVDCFDALTSDRPYRPRLSVADAFTIVIERRGTMYDPLVVDEFIRIHHEIAPAAARAGQDSAGLLSTAGLDDASALHSDSEPLRHIRATASETAVLSEFTQQLTRTLPTEALGELAWYSLRQLLPINVCALFEYDAASDSLVCHQDAGDPQHRLIGLRIRSGERITGWVAANQRSSMNSDPSLDLVHIAEHFTPPLQGTICAPIIYDSQLVGTLSAYSTFSSPFSEQHQYLIEAVASILADKWGASRRFVPHRSIVRFRRSDPSISPLVSEAQGGKHRSS